jgi:hypothetical protein
VRTLLPARRDHVVVKLEHAGTHYHVGFGMVPGSRQVVEVFADGRRTGTDFEAFLHDACIAMSLLVQHGCSCEMQAAAYGEHRNEGEALGTPASIMGVIARMGLELEKERK